jgi:RHS repeat-associated protein
VTATSLAGVSTQQTYDGFGDPAGVTAAFETESLLTLQYTRDALGRITGKTEMIGGSTAPTTYAYDAAGRLSRVERGGEATTYTYDVNGNRLTRTDAAGELSASYDAQDRLTTYGPATYTYTPVGDLRTKTVGSATTTYAYDELGNLLSVALPNGTDVEYLVDGQDRRIGKRVDGTLVQGFIYGDQLRVVAELEGDNEVASRFVYADGENVPAYMVKDGVTYRIVTDALGSVRLVVNAATGAVAQRLDYDEFGQVLVDTSPGFQPFGFAGGLYDRHTSLTHFGARDYDAETGRWTGKDPLGFEAGDPNLYAYVGSDPVNFTDPSGEEPTALAIALYKASLIAPPVAIGVVAGLIISGIASRIILSRHAEGIRLDALARLKELRRLHQELDCGNKSCSEACLAIEKELIEKDELARQAGIREFGSVPGGIHGG